MKNYEVIIRIMLIFLVVPVLTLSSFGCATNQKVTQLEEQGRLAGQRADAALFEVRKAAPPDAQGVQAAREADRAEAAADRAEAAAERAEAAAAKAEAIFDQRLRK